MLRLTIEIETGNADVADSPPTDTLGSAFEKIKGKLDGVEWDRMAGHGARIIDSNGQSIGKWGIIEVSE